MIIRIWNTIKQVTTAYALADDVHVSDLEQGN